MAKGTLNINLSELSEEVASQFRDLDLNEPGQWPVLPKALAWVLAAVAVVVVGWFLVLSPEAETLEAERNKEPQLKESYRSKLAQAVNLGELRKQRLQVQEYVTQLEKQLPGKAEMDALLSDINQAGLGRGLQFELFRPGQVVVKDYYAELPISISVSGRYHEIGSFAADIANLSRIVTLHDLNISVPKDGGPTLGMRAVARTYRYLDQAELEEQRKAQAAAAKAKGGKKK
ncbi:type 4a pilus biogenesis protein PilO [Caldimonas thermodepolymerans]|uniref:type 4a pilus biogenesis protein PilO n=1 Tax=Caldimonas thermodepolymerans TaxID=215580 RepID=UPI002236BCD0|nr:type 4a pilus biogenesis protein PilO [Caldimonas thermodepolymerans]UZG45057.1 type 4a pilus biogenesis protein PilO [Caldimonas thermodepolymerans]